MSNIEQTLSIIKPDAVERNLQDQIKIEFQKNGFEILKENDYQKAMNSTHESIGFALYYTSVTIIVGFSILVFSNFIPSIYFGLLTSMAMFIALFSSLVLLPQILIFFKPFKSPVNLKIS